MYATHFRLNGRLFAPGIAQDDATFVDARDADEGLPAAAALAAPDAVLVLVGPPGVGKTTLAAHTLRAAAGGMRSAVAWLSTPPATPHELLEFLLAEFGFEPYKQSRVERLQTWRQFLIELGATETRVFVAAERAHDVDASVLAALDALTSPDPNGCPGASLVLMGTDELRARLDEPALEPLRQRVRLVRRVRPLDAAAVERYLRHAATRAGGTLERLFSADAVAALASYSAGIPRVVNHLADGALALAALRRAPIVDAALVSTVAASCTFTRAPAFAAQSDSVPSSNVVPEPAAEEVIPELVTEDDIPVLAAGDDIPVLTESVDSGNDAAVLDLVDPAATDVLLEDELDVAPAGALDDDLDELSADLAAELLAADRAVGGAA